MGDRENERELKLQLAMVAARHHNSHQIKLISEIVEWMAAEVTRCGKLDHHEAAKAMRTKAQFFPGLIFVDEERNDRNGSVRQVYRFGPPVLKAFKELTGKTVRWGKDDRYWVAVKREQERRA